MLKLIQKLFLFGLLINISSVWAAPRLLATVDTNQVMLGETLTLKLELSGAGAIGEPDLSSLEDRFEIYGQQQFQSTQIINGQMSSQIVWQYTLEPQKTGILTIPALSLKTQAGHLRSKPIQIKVSITPVKRNDNIRLETIISNSNPYLHQPIHYTLRLYHRGELRNLEPVPPSDGVILEPLTQLSQQRTVSNGHQMIVAQISYLLTPLRSGKLELGSAKMKALKPDNRSRNFGGFGNFSFGNDYRPTTISSMPLSLEVQSPTSQPWLPLAQLQLKQKWESDITQPVVAGTPLIRTLTLIAKGMGGQATPNLEAFVPKTSDFRVRTPKPEIERGILNDKKTPISQITQSFSLIPLNIGTLQLPAIRIPWWNVQTKKLMWAQLPAQTIQVLPNQNYSTPSHVMAPTIPTKTESQPTPTPVAVRQPVSQPLYFSQAQYGLLACAIVALIIALGHSWFGRRVEFQKKRQSPVSSKPARMSESMFKKRLDTLTEAVAIKQLFQEYAHLRWQTPQNASLQTIVQHATTHIHNGELLAGLVKELNAALYGQQGFDLKSWKESCGLILGNLKEKKRAKLEDETVIFAPLNPV